MQARARACKKSVISAAHARILRDDNLGKRCCRLASRGLREGITYSYLAPCRFAHDDEGAVGAYRDALSPITLPRAVRQ